MTADDVTVSCPILTIAGSGIVVSPAVDVACVYVPLMYCSAVKSILVMATLDAMVKLPCIAFNAGKFSVAMGHTDPVVVSDPCQYCRTGIEIVVNAAQKLVATFHAPSIAFSAGKVKDATVLELNVEVAEATITANDGALNDVTWEDAR